MMFRSLLVAACPLVSSADEQTAMLQLNRRGDLSTDLSAANDALVSSLEKSLMSKDDGDSKSKTENKYKYIQVSKTAKCAYHLKTKHPIITEEKKDSKDPKELLLQKMYEVKGEDKTHELLQRAKAAVGEDQFKTFEENLANKDDDKAKLKKVEYTSTPMSPCDVLVDFKHAYESSMDSISDVTAMIEKTGAEVVRKAQEDLDEAFYKGAVAMQSEFRTCYKRPTDTTFTDDKRDKECKTSNYMEKNILVPVIKAMKYITVGSSEADKKLIKDFEKKEEATLLGKLQEMMDNKDFKASASYAKMKAQFDVLKDRVTGYEEEALEALDKNLQLVTAHSNKVGPSAWKSPDFTLIVPQFEDTDAVKWSKHEKYTEADRKDMIDRLKNAMLKGTGTIEGFTGFGMDHETKTTTPNPLTIYEKKVVHPWKPIEHICNPDGNGGQSSASDETVACTVDKGGCTKEHNEVTTAGGQTIIQCTSGYDQWISARDRMKELVGKYISYRFKLQSLEVVKALRSFWNEVLKVPETRKMSSLPSCSASKVCSQSDDLFWEQASGYLAKPSKFEVEAACLPDAYDAGNPLAFEPRKICEGNRKLKCVDEFVYLSDKFGKSSEDAGIKETCEAVMKIGFSDSDKLTKKEVKECLEQGKKHGSDCTKFTFMQYNDGETCRTVKDLKHACDVFNGKAKVKVH